MRSNTHFSRDKMGKLIRALDLFCGAGGTSTGLARACADADQQLELVAVNHWDIAIQTHSANHRTAKQLCKPVKDLEPRDLPPGTIDLLIASPECTHHSMARGGRPMSDQSRSQPWMVLEWIEKRTDRLTVLRLEGDQTRPRVPLAYREGKAHQLLGIGRRLFWQLVHEGSIRPRVLGGRRLYLHDDLQAFIEGLPVDREAVNNPPTPNKAERISACP